MGATVNRTRNLKKKLDRKHLVTALERGGLRISKRAQEILAENGSVDTGTLQDSVTYEVEVSSGGMRLRVGTNVAYAPFVELGTAPHIIRPKEKAALAGGKLTHPIKKVDHPGSPPKPFLKPAADQEKAAVLDEVAAAVSRQLEVK
ncbi:MAG: HK97 gp10 family phage protein [Chloroflexi bacterium]|nr:MAG: HK97 gp10 family phage protein [Chloroflexota bacterium]